jgi:hypothetical protein
MLMVSTRRKTWVGKKEEAAVSSQAEENMALARRFMEARIKGDLEAVDETGSGRVVVYLYPKLNRRSR